MNNEEIKNDPRLAKLQHFFSVDTFIKKEIYKMVPPSDNVPLNDETIMKYTDSLYESLIYIFNELKCICLDLFGQYDIYAKIINLEENTKKQLADCGIDIGRLRKFYQMFISDMSIDFVNAVKYDFVGYSFRGGADSVKLAKTVNEFLHLFHAYVMNNDNILKSIPLRNSKNNEYDYPISLRGCDVDIFNRLYEGFPLDLDVGWTDLVAIDDNKLLMMVRDRGHALTIEITLFGDKARVEYFIPKLCNIEMINDLPGVNKVDENSIGATGVIEIPKEQLNGVLFNFISRVPTDADMKLRTY